MNIWIKVRAWTEIANKIKQVQIGLICSGDKFIATEIYKASISWCERRFREIFSYELGPFYTLVQKVLQRTTQMMDMFHLTKLDVLDLEGSKGFKCRKWLKHFHEGYF